MPTYEYLCKACDHRFDHFQSLSEKRLRKCPECGRPKLERQFGTGAGIVFKGSGFYETDYRSKGYTESAKQDASAKKDTEGAATETDGKAGASKKAGADGSKDKGSKPSGASKGKNSSGNNSSGKNSSANKSPKSGGGSADKSPGG